jgi:hypothetical protein
MRFIAEQVAWPCKMSDSADVKLSSKKKEMDISAGEKHAGIAIKLLG